VEATLVRDTKPRPSDGRFGDGIIAHGLFAPANLSIHASRIENSARAGIASFGSFVSLSDSRVQCAGFDLEGEILDGQNFSFDDGGGNACGCPTADHPCAVVSTNLDPPEIPPPLGE
jgi:hypothetical protein